MNVSAIPHELLLRQNTLVSRHAHDTGFRYIKDLNNVFDLTSGQVKIRMPAHLVIAGRLIEDPAAVMEALLLEDKFEEGYEKLSGDKRVFSLEHMFYKDDLTECHRISKDTNCGKMKPSTIPQLIQVAPHMIKSSPLFYMRPPPNQQMNSFNTPQTDASTLVRELSNSQPSSSNAAAQSGFNYVEMLQRYYETISKRNQLSASAQNSTPQNQTLAYPLNNVRISIQNEPQLATNPAVVAAMDGSTVFSEAQRMLLSKIQEDERKNKRKAVQPTRRFSQDSQSPSSLMKSQPNLTVTPPHVDEGVADAEPPQPPPLHRVQSPKMNHPAPRTHSSEAESELMIYLSSPTTSSTDGGGSSSAASASSFWRAPSRDCTDDVSNPIL